MKIEDIINQINFRSNPKSALYFELFIQNLLKLHLEKQGKQFISDYVIDFTRPPAPARQAFAFYQNQQDKLISYALFFQNLIYLSVA